MKDLLVSFIVAGLTLSMLAVPLAAAQAQGGGGVLGPVDALGQQVRRPPPPTTPPPRLPDGTIDLGDGIWVYNGFGADIGVGLKKGETMPLLPAAKTLMASRKDTDDPENWCLPPGVLRSSPYPFRFIQNYTHKKPTHMYIQRWTRVDSGHLVEEVTLDDPGAFSRPFTVTFQATLSNPGDELIEYVCQENNQYGIASGVR
jgi:hypothetical protein